MAKREAETSFAASPSMTFSSSSPVRLHLVGGQFCRFSIGQLFISRPMMKIAPPMSLVTKLLSSRISRP